MTPAPNPSIEQTSSGWQLMSKVGPLKGEPQWDLYLLVVFS